MAERDAPGWLTSRRSYRRLAIITTAGICFLVVAGGAVRLTGSGLGCDDWPNCNNERFIDVSSFHTAIEQLNRLLSGVIGVPTLLLVVAAFRQGGRGFRWPAVGVLVTVLANGVVGGIAVRSDLHPALIQSHFLLAMASISFGMIAIHRASPGQETTNSGRQVFTLALTGLTALALATGTVVTGTGPHAGDETARRFDFDISQVARVHAVTVIIALLVAIALAWRVRADGPSAFVSTLSAWIFIGLLQGAVGYTQYFNGVPELLVGVHIALATGLWLLTMRLVTLGTSTPMKKPEQEIARGPLQKA